MIALVTTVALVGPAAAFTPPKYGDRRDTCELVLKVVKDDDGDMLHFVVNCDGKQVFHADRGFYFPKGGPHDRDHRCELTRLEQIDKLGYLLTTKCKYHPDPYTRGPLQIQFDGRDIQIENTENY